MALNFNPYLTTNAAGSFSVTSDGFVQGTAMDDPSIRNALAGGVLGPNELLPMWGGVAITESIPAATVDGSLGGTITRASSNANITGFSVINQAIHWLTMPQSPAPSIGPGGSVPFYRLGSGARIAVAINPSLVSIDGGLITQQVSWDINNQVLQPYDASTPTVSVTSITSSFSNGVYTFVVVAAAASNVGGVGDFINISGVTGTGAALVNGNQTVTAFTDNQHFSFQITAASGAIATGALAGTILLNEGTGALNVKVLQLNIGNSKTTVYNASTGFVTYNPNGSTAIILI